CLYELKIEKVSRPVVKFKDSYDVTMFASPAADTNVTFELDIPPYTWAFKPLPEIKAIDVTATNRQDYAFDNGEIATNGVIEVTLKNNVSAWRPERKFKLELSPDENGFYYIPDERKSLELTLKADPSEPPESVELSEVPEIPVGERFTSYDDRNLNNTNTSDTLYFHVTNGVDYVLAATDVVTKPADAAKDITVTVYTNLSSVTANVIPEETYGPAVTNWYSIVTTTNLYCEADGSTVTNSIDIVETNAVDFSELESATNWWVTAKHWSTAKIVTTTETDSNDISVTNILVTTNWTYHVGIETNSWTAGPAITNYFTVFETATNIATRTQRKPEWTLQDLEPCVEQKEFKVAEGSVATNTYITVTITNNCEWVEYGSWKLSDIANSDTMPLLRFLELGDIKVEVTREANPSVLAQYSLGLSQWVTTTVQFAEVAWTNNQKEAEMHYTLLRRGDMQLKSTAYVTLTCGTARDGVDVASFEKKAVTFEPGETNASVFVENLMAKTPGIWKGDRTFSLSLSVEDSKLTLGAVSNATVVLKSHIPEYEDGDSADERSSKPAVTNALNASWAGFGRTMNGRDDKDCFLFTNIVGGVRYRFSLELKDGTTNNLETVKTTFYTNECWESAAVELENWNDLLGRNFDFEPVEGVTNITVKLARKSSAEPASMGY
ncbi:MAG: hypothetical protein J6W10_07700, partial [Kiritimatiellae bacterium]|nr:hypothetical protein [Kiritimatiellia bacterium]